MQDAKGILQKIRRLELKTRRLVNASFAGQYHSVFKGRGMNFEEVREYAIGDEIRSIDWNVTARMNEPYVKRFTEEREMTVLLLVDVSASGNYGSISQSKREFAAEVAAILAFSAIQNGDKVGLLLFSDQVELFIPPKKGRQHILRLIRDMIYFEPKGRGTDINIALEYANRLIRRQALFFMISDFQAEDFSKPLTVSSRKHDVVALPITDPCEEELPDVGLVTFEDGETGQQIEINTSNKHLQETYRELEAQRLKEQSHLFRSRRIDIVPLRTDRDYLKSLRNFFEMRERRNAA
ncbi:MAG: DUF58 domain-containing protein [Chthoniobacterales bacterium]